MPQIQSLFFVGTLNNYTDVEVESMKKLDCSYLCIGFETGEQGTPHLQFYIEFHSKIDRNKLSKLIPRAFLEKRRGNQQQAIDYCKKDGKFYERGEPKLNQKGRRNDMEAAHAMAMEHGMRAVTAQFNPQVVQSCEKFMTYNEPERDWITIVLWLYGETGVGKSRLARSLCHEYVDEPPFVKSAGHKWWDGYDANLCVILDDFRYDWFKFEETLSLLDRYGKRVEVKGGFRQFRPRLIIITCNKAPEHECQGMAEQPIGQLLRRITCVKEIKDDEASKKLKLKDLYPEFKPLEASPEELLSESAPASQPLSWPASPVF